MKRLVAALAAIALIATMSLNVFAATPTRTNSKTRRTVATVTLNDLVRLQDVLNENVVGGKQLGKVESVPSGTEVRIINAKQLASNEWVIRVDADGQQTFKGDYYVFTREYVCNEEGLPFNVPTLATDTAKYGPAWFYCGLFDDTGSHDIIGYAIAQRIKRWPMWEDLAYTTGSDAAYLDTVQTRADGTTFKNVGSAQAVASLKGISLPYIVGHYDGPSEKNWLANHLPK